MTKLEKLSHLFRILDSIVDLEIGVTELSKEAARELSRNPLSTKVRPLLKFCEVMYDSVKPTEIKSICSETLNRVMEFESDREAMIGRIFTEAKRTGREA